MDQAEIGNEVHDEKEWGQGRGQRKMTRKRVAGTLSNKL